MVGAGLNKRVLQSPFKLKYVKMLLASGARGHPVEKRVCLNYSVTGVTRSLGLPLRLDIDGVLLPN